ncbi:Glucuronosyltransferase [Aphelenchoides besseyi]|nr:Glucuronosyltransferase [Aphelenchoides besseyi]
MHKDAWLINHQSYFEGIQLFAGLGEEFRLACEDQLKDEKLIETLRNENFDLASFVSSTTEKMSMWERITNIASHYIYKYQVIGNHLGETARAFPSDMADYQEVLARSQYVFVNLDEHYDFLMPISSKIVYIGGLNMRDTQKTKDELSPEIKDACENSRRGCVLISFGTIASSYAMDINTKQAFVEAIQRFPDVTFIWKYEKEPDFDLPSNLRILSWLSKTSSRTKLHDAQQAI